MAKYAHADVLDGGLSAIKSGAIRMLLISGYTAADSYATVVAAKVAEVTMSSSDFTITGSDGAARVLTTASGKSATASANSGATPNLHIAFTDNSSKVLWVTDETSDQVVTSGNTVNFPQITYTSSQPT
jgi:hypothetical protein